jgi:hypothetical protein
VLPNVSFGKLGVASGVCKSTDNEESNYVLAFSLDLPADASLKELEDHALLATILEIVTNPDSVSKVLGIKEGLSVTVIENDIFATLSNGFFNLLRS